MSEIGYDAMWSHKERKKIATLDRRARFLEARNGGDHDEGEAAAIRWALKTLDAARATSPEPTLDVAWREAEAALPEGWQFELGRLDFDGPWDAFAKSRAFWEDDHRVADREEQTADGEGPTPAAALLALAARLRGPA